MQNIKWEGNNLVGTYIFIRLPPNTLNLLGKDKACWQSFPW